MSKRAGMKTTKITVGQLIDLIDYNRDGQEYVLVSERDDFFCKLYTDSIALDQISDLIIDSIGAEEDVIKIWIDDSCITDYWERSREWKVTDDERPD